MGRTQAIETASAERVGFIDRDTLLLWHLRHNHLPPLPDERGARQMARTKIHVVVHEYGGVVNGILVSRDTRTAEDAARKCRQSYGADSDSGDEYLTVYEFEGNMDEWL